MNWAFARSVGLPKFFARRASIALRRSLSDAPVSLRLPTGQRLICPPWSLSAQDACHQWRYGLGRRGSVPLSFGERR